LYTIKQKLPSLYRHEMMILQKCARPHLNSIWKRSYIISMYKTTWL